MTTPSSAPVPVSEPQAPSTAPVLSYNSEPYAAMPQYTIVSQGGEIQQGIWAQLARQGYSQENFVSAQVVDEASTDDIIQKSLAMSGISQEMIEASRTPKRDSPSALESESVESHNMNALQTVNSRSIAMRGGAPSLNKDMTNSVTPQGAELVDADQLSDQEVAVEDDTDHACDACGKSFDTVQSLLFHLREHVNNCQYECASCNALFRLSSELQKHVKTCKMAVRFRPYHCDHCDLTFYKKTAFHRHVIQHKENRTRFPCDVCQKSFASASYLKKHQESHESPKGQNEPDENGGTEIDKTSKKKVVRKECGTKNTDEVSGPKIDEVDLVSEDDEDDENGIEVGELKENRSKSRTLRKRPKQNLAEIIDPDDEEEFDMIYVAPPTSKKPPVVRAAAKPRKPRSTTPEKRIRLGKAPKMLPPVKKLLKCGKCGHGFENAEERRKHVQIHTTVLSDREHMCLVCGKTYTMGCNLERHALVHTNTRLHRCDLCGKGFHRVDILDRHRRIHTGEKPHECPICELRFISTAALLTHKKRVHADKRFSCDKCTESFLTDNLLERHKKSHNANRRFTCDKCGKSFINTSNLKTHMRIHTREKPFICDHCGERFTQKAHVERHILIHTRPKQAKDEENPPLNAEAIQQFVKQLYFCPTCNKSFPKRRGLRMHERMRHGIGKGLKVKPEMALPTEQTVHHPVVQVVQQQQVQQNPQTWYPPVIHQQQVPHQQQQQQQQPQQQHQQQRPPQQQQQQQQQQLQQQQPQQQQQQQPMQQQQIQYAVPVNQVQHCTVYNPSNGNVYTQQYLHQGLNQQFDIQIQQPLGQEDQVIFTAADSHDTIMYLIEAAASSNMINQPLQQNQIQAQMIHPDHFHQHNGEQRFGEMTTIHVQQAPQHQILQQQQIQIQQAPIQQQPQQAQQQQQLIAVVEQPIKMPKRPKMEKNALGAKPYKCSNCGEHFASSGVLVKHMRIHTGEKPYTCTHCGKSFTQVGNLHRHVKSHQGIRNHRCNICGKSFTRRERLLYHSKLHTGEKNFKCGECGKEFGHKVNLMAHYNRRHSGYRPHGCNLCNKSFAEKRALKFHLKTHAPKSTDKDHICSECGRAFRTPERLASHSRVHSNLRPHKCTLCSKSYTLPTSLRSHYAAHHAPKLSEGMQLNCTECPKKFTTRMQLLSHQKIHSTPKYECDVCHKKFTVSSNLKNHLRVHSGEKPFKCDKCGQSFAQRGHLLRHVRPCVKKRFSCLECSASFSNLNALSRHINKSHGLPPKKRFPCDQCDLHFSSAASLQKHVQTEHPLIAYVETVDITNKATNDETEADPLSIVDSKCLSCDKTFADETELDAHVINCAFKPLTTDHRGGANRKQAVDKASTATKNLKTRNASVKKQEGKSVVAKTPGTKKDCSKPFKCATCSNCFSSIAQLRNHAKKHVGEVFKCTHCQENFTGAATLKTHLETCPSHETEIVDTGEPALLQPSDSAGVSVVPIVPDNAEIPGIVHNNPSRLSLPVPV